MHRRIAPEVGQHPVAAIATVTWPKNALIRPIMMPAQD